MSQVVKIAFSQDSEGLLRDFLNLWDAEGWHEECGGDLYFLHRNSRQSDLILRMQSSDRAFTFEGYTSDEEWVVIENFAKKHNATIYYEDQILEQPESAKPNIIGALLTILLMLGVLVMLPFTILIALMKFLWGISISRLK